MQRVINRLILVFLIFLIAMLTFKIIQSSKIVAAPAVTLQEHKSEINKEQTNIEEIIKNYLLAHPEVIIDSLEQLQQKKIQESGVKAKNYLETNRSDIENSNGMPILGDENGDVTIVAFYDYTCSYCKKGDNNLKDLLKEDDKVKIILRPLPILGDEAKYSAKIALAVNKLFPGKFHNIHDNLMSIKPMNKENVHMLLLENEINIEAVENESESNEIKAILDKNAQMAQSLRIQGVPAYVINAELIPGLLDLDKLKTLINEIREQSGD